MSGIAERGASRMLPMKSQLIDDGSWTARADLIVRIASPEVSADKLGLTIKDVLERRQELGLSAHRARRKRLARAKAK